MMKITPVVLSRAFKSTMIEHAVRDLPNECCGLLVGREGKIERIIPMKSDPPAPDAYLMDPLQQIAVFTEMEKRGESLLGIYHSHPAGPECPSSADLRLACHPGVVHCIISLSDSGNPVIRGFLLSEGAFTEVRIEYE